MDDVIAAFWHEYIEADELKRSEMLEKTLVRDLHKVIEVMPNDDMKKFIIVSTFRSCIDDLIEYYEDDS